MDNMNFNSKIYVAGHQGLVGSAIWRNLESKGYTNLIGRSFAELDLRNQSAVEAFFEAEKPEYVILAAAKVGGIMANNTYRGEFIYENLMVQNNVIHQAYIHGVKKLLFLGSTCIYPKESPQPMKEEYLLTGPLEPTNEPYAIAKIAGIKLCESYNIQYGTNFISVMPTNLYGPNDNFDLEKSHVLPALLRKMHQAKLLQSSNVEVWGSGKPMREFMWSEDMADACIYLMEKNDEYGPASMPARKQATSFVNIGTGKEISIKDLALLIKKIVGFQGELVFNSDKPDGPMRKVTDVTRLHLLGWHHSVELEEGIRRLYDWYRRRLEVRG